MYISGSVHKNQDHHTTMPTRDIQKYQYTDDTAMMKCIAESLISEKGFDAVDMAKR
jgi:ADP-ribosylglycohydrolase